MTYSCPFALHKCAFQDIVMTPIPRDGFLNLSTTQEALSPDFPTFMSPVLQSFLHTPQTALIPEYPHWVVQVLTTQLSQ